MTKSLKSKNNSKKDFVWNAIGLTLNACNSLFFLIVVRFVNGLDIAGIFTYAFALCIFLYAFAIYFNRSFQVSDSKYSFNDYLTCRTMTSIISFIAIFIFAIINQFSGFEIAIVLLLSGFRIVEAISDCFYGAIQEKNRLYQTGISLSLKAIFGLLIFFIVDWLTHDLALSIVALIIINLLFFCFYDLKNYRKLYTNKIKLDFTHLKSILKTALPIVIFSALAIYLSNCQKYVLPYFESDEIQAIFGILIMPATVLGLVGSYLINPFINKFTLHHQQKNYAQYISSAQKLLVSLAGIGLIALVICYFIGIPLLELIFQIDLAIYLWPLQLIILASIFYAAAMIISSLLTILGENRRQTYIYLIASIVATVVAILLIPPLGIFGAVYSFLISSVVLIILYLILLQRKLYGAKNDK
ncbi:polysaccharide biosynthesis C-terminal domain-containing protein [Candidatus Saccharibacteria bacterium]|nr:polysaccharide biosynthesis C-terminal domain-containing protein [Candidatus Saccharibacteria bacterium]